MHKPLDIAALHIRAKSWADKIYKEYQDSKIEHVPEQIPPEMGVENARDTRLPNETASPEETLGGADNLY